MKRLAVLGLNSATARLLAQWRADQGWQIVAAAGIEASVDRSVIPPEVTIEDPELWYGGVEADAVIVTADSVGCHDELLKKLAALEMPLLVVYPAFDGLFAHELQMHYSSTSVPVLVWYPQRRLEWEMQAGQVTAQVGSIQQIRWTTTLERDLSAEALRQACVVDLVRAAHWCLPLSGHYRTMQALNPTGDRESIVWERLAVTMLSHDDVTVHWQVRQQPGLAQPRTVVEIEGTRAKVEYHYDHGTREWSGAAIESAESAAQGIGAKLTRIAEGTAVGDDWLGACQGLEIADLIEFSVRRRRMVDLVQEAPTEEAAFKGVMAAGSCALLLLVLAIFAIGSLYESVRRPRPRPGSRTVDSNVDRQAPTPTPARWWRFWPVIPLAVYLLLQTLILVARGSRPDRSEDRVTADGASLRDAQPEDGR